MNEKKTGLERLYPFLSSRAEIIELMQWGVYRNQFHFTLLDLSIFNIGLIKHRHTQNFTQKKQKVDGLHFHFSLFRPQKFLLINIRTTYMHKQFFCQKIFSLLS